MVSIDMQAHELKSVSENISQNQLIAIRNFLDDKTINTILKEAGYTPRKSSITPTMTILHYLSSALFPEASFQSSATTNGLKFSSGGLAKSRQRLPIEALTLTNEYVKIETFKQLEVDLAFGRRVLSVDGTSISMEDIPKLADEFGRNKTCHGEGRYPLAKLVAINEVNSRTIIAHKTGKHYHSEQSIFLEMLDAFREKDILIGDAHFAKAHVYSRLKERGIDFVTPIHQRLKIDKIEKIIEHSKDDFIGNFHVSTCLQKKFNLPKTVKLRFIRTDIFSRRGKNMEWLVTSLFDSKMFPPKKIKNLFFQRWQIEESFEQLKVGLSADVLRSKTVKGIYNEIESKVLAYNLLRYFIIEAAKKAQVEPSRISFCASRRIITSYSLRMSLAPIDLLPTLYTLMINDLANAYVKYRPGRSEPRAIRREKKHYASLKKTRSEWRNEQKKAA